MSKILLDLRDLPEGASKVRLEGDLEALDLRHSEYLFQSPATVALDVHKSEQEIQVSGRVSIAAQVECARCVSPCGQEIQAGFRARYIRVRGEPKLQDQSSDSLVREIGYDECVLDLTEEAREALILSLPIRALCKPDCKGLCPTCGADLNESECSCDRKQGHPAWSALEKLKGGGKET